MASLSIWWLLWRPFINERLSTRIVSFFTKFHESIKLITLMSAVKLRNYIIQPTTKMLKICDFSLARQFALGDAGQEQEGEQLVKGGATLAYISPEQTTRIPGYVSSYCFCINARVCLC